MNDLLYFGSIMMSIMSILQMASAKYNRNIQNPPDLSQKYTENVNSLTASLVQLGFNLLALTSSWIPGSWSLRHGRRMWNNQSGLKSVNPEEFSEADSFIQRWEERNIYIYIYTIHGQYVNVTTTTSNIFTRWRRRSPFKDRNDNL